MAHYAKKEHGQLYVTKGFDVAFGDIYKKCSGRKRTLEEMEEKDICREYYQAQYQEDEKPKR